MSDSQTPESQSRKHPAEDFYLAKLSPSAMSMFAPSIAGKA